MSIIDARRQMAARPRRRIRGPSVAKQSSVLDLDRASPVAVVREDESAQQLAEYTVVLAVTTVSIVLAIARLATNGGTNSRDSAKLLLP